MFTLALTLPLEQRDPGHENWHKGGRCEQCKSLKKHVNSMWWCKGCGVWLCHIREPSLDYFLLWHGNREE